MNKISMDKQYTSNGSPVRLLCLDGGGAYPVVGLAGGYALQWMSDGRYRTSETEGLLDLIEVKPRIKREYFMNLYPYDWDVFTNKAAADENAGANRIACVKVEIDCEEGEGL